MPVTPTFPGIYIEEIQSTAHTITAAPTSVGVFIGYSHQLKTPAENFGVPVEVFSFSEYEQQFGGFFQSDLFSSDSAAATFGDLANAVNQFFLNGGSDAWIVALRSTNVASSTMTPTVDLGPATLTAREWTDANHVMTVIVRNTSVSPLGGSPPFSPPQDDTADIVISYGPPQLSGQSAPAGTVTEVYRQVSVNAFDTSGQPNPNYIVTRLGTSQLVTAAINAPINPFVEGATKFAEILQGSSPAPFNAVDFTDAMQADTPLDKLAIFNLLVLPGVVHPTVLNTALAFAERKRAFLIMDPPITATADANPKKIQDVIADAAMPKGKNGALYFPYLKSPDPTTGLSINPATKKAYEMPPSGTVAGICARTDLNRGVWKAPAGLQANTVNTVGVADRGKMTDQRHGVLNPLGVNVLRDFPNVGTVVFGARTLVTNTEEQWRYVPVRRMALFLEQTLYASLGWVVFEPNDEPLWASVRTSIEAFMHGLFRQQAFQGSSPSEAFQVKCDKQTTTQTDIDNGIVNILVAFAPLKPAEFVIIKIAQLAGQAQAS